MWKQSVWSSGISAALAAHHLKPGGCVVLPGEKACIFGANVMILKNRQYRGGNWRFRPKQTNQKKQKIGKVIITFVFKKISDFFREL
jgi:hypothetical protein